MLSLGKALWLAGLIGLGGVGTFIALRRPNAPAPAPVAPPDAAYFQELLRGRDALGWTAEQHEGKAAEIADRFERAYDTAPGLTVSVEIEEFHPYLHARAEMRMARGRLRSEVYLPAFNATEPTFVFTLSNGRYTEWRAPWQGRPAQQLSRRFDPTDPANSELLEAQDVAAYWCMLGGCLSTSIGAETFCVRALRAHLAAGQYVGARPWDGDAVCDVVVRELYDPGEPYHAQVFYVDSRGYLVQREKYHAVDPPPAQPRLVYRSRCVRAKVSEWPEEPWDFVPWRPRPGAAPIRSED
jgi:hypothetical protein